MKDVSIKLLNLVNRAVQQFENISNDDWELKTDPLKWSKKEILGHLIDSAANNHHRFVRTQFEETPIIAYSQNKWADVQFYNNADLENLLSLWQNYNKHIAYIISVIPEENLKLKCDIRIKEPATLKWIINDYVDHTQHHIDQIINSE